MTDVPHTTDPTNSNRSAPESSPSCGWREIAEAMHVDAGRPECDRPDCDRPGEPIRIVKGEPDDGTAVLAGVRCSDHAKALLEATS